MESRQEKARELFLQGYNCCQAVVAANADRLGIPFETLMKLSSPFGGGLARQREVCGVVTGMCMVYGLLKGSADPADKSEVYRAVRELCRQFREQTGSIVCRELLAGVEVAPGPEPEARTPEYYKKRPCPELARAAAEIMGEYIEAHPLPRQKDEA